MIGVGISLSSAASYAKDLGVPVESVLQLNSNGLTLGGNLDNSRSSTATILDLDGVYRTAKAGETRLQGGRRVENLIPYSGDFSNAAWLRVAGGTGAVPTKTVNAATAPDDTQTACRLQLNRGAGNTANDYAMLKVDITSTTNGRGSIYVRSVTGSYTIGIGTNNIRSEITVTTTWQRITHTIDTSAATQFQIEIRGGASNSSTADLYIWHPEFSDTTGASVTSPPDYIDSRTEYNATTLGVRYYSTTNSNTVASNVVTAGSGGTISPAPYILLEPAATNYFLNSDAPATQTIALAAGTYTIWVVGSGSITLSSGATGTVTSAAPLTFTTSGSTVFTVSGSLTKVQVESGSKATSYIPTAGASASRSADDIFTTATLDSNWFQNNGIFLMKFTPMYSTAETSATPLFNSGTLTVSPNPTGYTLSDGTSSVSSAASGLVSGTTSCVAFLWDVDESQMSVNYSNDAGVTWASWHSEVYDGTFTLPANFEWFKSSPFVNHLHACRIYKTPNKTVNQAQLWVEANATSEMT